MIFILRWIHAKLIWLVGQFYYVRRQRDAIENTDAGHRSEHFQKEDRKREFNQDVITLKRELDDMRTRNKELQREVSRVGEEVSNLKRDCDQLRTRNQELHTDLNRRDLEISTLKKDCNMLRTRLSQTAAIQLTQGNPNIADLSDQNRPDKLAEQFSELYDNQWTDCYQVLVDDVRKSEQVSISILLNIVKTSYDICFGGCQNILTSTKDILVAFVGRSDEKPDNALDALIQEILHKLKSHRTKSFKGVPTNIEKKVKETIMSQIGERETKACDCFIDECIRTCWLMCIKDPPMFISCDHDAVFDKNKYMEYTEMGHSVAYVVWPALYLHKDGPLMRKGVAQGKGKHDQEKTREVNTDASQKVEPDITNPMIENAEHTMKAESQEKTDASMDVVTVDDILIEEDICYGERFINKHTSQGNACPHENTSCSISQHGDKIISCGNAPSGNNICDSTKDMDQEQMDQSKNVPILSDDSESKENEVEDSQSAANDETTERKEQSEKSILDNEYCQPRKLNENGSLNAEENKVKETRDKYIQLRNGHEVMEALNIVDPSLPDSVRCSPNGYEEKEQPISSTDVILEDGKGKTYSIASAKDNAMDLKEQIADKLVLLDEYCKQNKALGASCDHDEENQRKETNDRFIEYDKFQDVKEGSNTVLAHCAKNIDDSLNKNDDRGRPMLTNDCILSDASVREEIEENFHSSTKAEATIIKQLADNNLLSSNEYYQHETSGTSNINEDVNQGKEMEQKCIEKEGTKPVEIGSASLAKNIGCSVNDNEEEETPQLINEHSSSDESFDKEK